MEESDADIPVAVFPDAGLGDVDTLAIAAEELAEIQRKRKKLTYSTNIPGGFHRAYVDEPLSALPSTTCCRVGFHRVPSACCLANINRRVQEHAGSAGGCLTGPFYGGFTGDVPDCGPFAGGQEIVL